MTTGDLLHRDKPLIYAIYPLWKHGHDTLDISRRLGLTEAAVVRAMYRWRQDSPEARRGEGR